jgi:hypothetical protein
VEIVTGIDPSLPVTLIRMAPPFLGLLGQLGAFNVDAPSFNRSVLLSVLVDAWPSEAQGAVIR